MPSFFRILKIEVRAAVSSETPVNVPSVPTFPVCPNISAPKSTTQQLLSCHPRRALFARRRIPCTPTPSRAAARSFLPMLSGTECSRARSAVTSFLSCSPVSRNETHLFVARDALRVLKGCGFQPHRRIPNGEQGFSP
jgi:hypothetical protein